MPITTTNDFKMYPTQFHTGQVETLMQDTNVFNAASNGAISLVPLPTVGDYRKHTIFTQGLHITHRDPNSTALATPTKMQQGELVSAKMHKRYQVETTKQAFRDIGEDMGMFSDSFGVQSAKEKQAKYLNSGLIALRSMMGAVGVDVRHDAAGEIDHKEIIKGMAKFGDKSREIVAFVAHSALEHKLLEKTIDDNVHMIAGATITSGSTATFGRPLIITDSPALIDTANVGRYFMFGLTAGALAILETQEDDVLTEVVGGHDNQLYRIQGEFGFNIEAKGVSYTGAANPDDAVLAVPANFSQIVSDIKSTPGVLISAAA